MLWYRNLRMIYKIMIPVSAMLIIALALLTLQIQSRSSSAIQAVAERELEAMTEKYGGQVLAFFNVPLYEAKAVSDALARAAEQGRPVPRDMQMDAIRGLQLGNPVFLGVGLAWEPNALGSDAPYAGTPGHDASGRFIPYAAVGEEIAILEGYETSEYFAIPKRFGRAHLAKPFLYPIAGKDVMMTTASVPIKVNGQFAGLTMVDLSMESVLDLVTSIRVYQTGAAIMLNQEGEILAHNRADIIGTSIFEQGLVRDRAAMTKAMAEGTPYHETNFINGRDTFVYYTPVHFALTGQTWYLGLNAPTAEVLVEARQISIVTAVISLITLLLAMIVIYIVVRGSVRPVSIIVASAKEIAGGNLKVHIRDESFGGGKCWNSALPLRK